VRILFWGTPSFAVPPLRALLGEGFEVCGVVTQPDRPVGRARTVTPSPVKRAAGDEGLPLFQPATPRDPAFGAALDALKPDISVVVAYGHILPRAVIDLPCLGTLNIHASLLPALRGAAPIQGALRAGMSETGVSIMRMIPALDAGPVLLQSRTPVADDETFGELQERLAELGALTLIESLALIEIGRVTEHLQDDSLATYAPKITRETTRVDWSMSAREIANTVRAFDPRPGAWTSVRGTDVKLFGARPVTTTARATTAPGEVLGLQDGALRIACGDGAVDIADVQPAGRRRMPAAEWDHGRGIVLGDRLD